MQNARESPILAHRCVCGAWSAAWGGHEILAKFTSFLHRHSRIVEHIHARIHRWWARKYTEPQTSAHTRTQSESYPCTITICCCGVAGAAPRSHTFVWFAQRQRMPRYKHSHVIIQHRLSRSVVHLANLQCYATVAPALRQASQQPANQSAWPGTNTNKRALGVCTRAVHVCACVCVMRGELHGNNTPIDEERKQRRPRTHTHTHKHTASEMSAHYKHATHRRHSYILVCWRYVRTHRIWFTSIKWLSLLLALFMCIVCRQIVPLPLPLPPLPPWPTRIGSCACVRSLTFMASVLACVLARKFLCDDGNVYSLIVCIRFVDDDDGTASVLVRCVAGNAHCLLCI